MTGAYHIKSHDMLEGYFTRLVLLDEDLIDLNGRGTRRQPQDKGVLCCRVEGIDPISWSVRRAIGYRGVGGQTNDVFGDIS